MGINKRVVFRSETKRKTRIDDFYEMKSLEAGIAGDRLQALLELIGDCSGKKILDVGCGKGLLLKHLTNCYKIGVDISQKALGSAKSNCDEVHVLNLDLDGLSVFDDESFDIIIMAEVLEHLFFPNSALKEARRVIKKGGFLILSVPNSATLANRLRILVGKFVLPDEDEHIRFFDLAKIKEVLARCRFEIVDSRYTPAYVPLFPKVLSRSLSKIRPQLFARQFIFKLIIRLQT